MKSNLKSRQIRSLDTSALKLSALTAAHEYEGMTHISPNAKLCIIMRLTKRQHISVKCNLDTKNVSTSNKSVKELKFELK